MSLTYATAQVPSVGSQKRRQSEKCLLYLDDFIVPVTIFIEALQTLEKSFERLRNANLKLKLKLFQKYVKLIGHVVSQEGVQTDADKTEARKGWPIPKTAKYVRSRGKLPSINLSQDPRIFAGAPSGLENSFGLNVLSNIPLFTNIFRNKQC